MTSLDAPVPDVLGGEFTARTITLAPDGQASGPPVATLVRLGRERTRDVAVMYLHGFTDYFFQADHAAAWAEHGYDFFALDLRDYGRSIRPGRQPGWVEDLRSYDEELDAALAAIRAEGYRTVMLLGHSTGGLIATLYASDHPGSVDALVLNSPWFDLNENWFYRVIATRVVDLVGPRVPHLKVGSLDQAYGRHLHVSTGGPYDYDLAWKPVEGFEAHAGWLRAIRRGHARIAHGLDVDAPVLMCTSARSGSANRPSQDDLDGADCVLDVEHMHGRIGRVGPDVTAVRITGGWHDLALSGPAARAEYERTVFDWLAARLRTGANAR
ncbi:alpha/beta hydrolase [Occultella aeris]|uniref:alpha/beta hydrolase n=1 Tax=Occultella aeris TaxID=2761496 RepID=UPI0012EADE53|nr:alpha/beta hydrolase [Occultella aeris]